MIVVILVAVCFALVWDTSAILLRHPFLTANLVAWTALTILLGPHDSSAIALWLALSAVAWRIAHRASWQRLAGWHLRTGWRRWWIYERHWKEATKESGLARVRQKRRDQFPTIEKMWATPFGDTLIVKMLRGGQNADDWEDAAADLTSAFEQRACRVFREDNSRRIRLEFLSEDVLQYDIPAFPIPATDEEVDLESVAVGNTEHGTVWRLRILGSHLLIAGLTGAGKGSVFWSIIRGLAPAIRSRRVELWGLDPKGGMELGFGRELFAHYCAGSAQQMADMLASAVTQMETRTKQLAQVTRKHVPTVEMPLVVIVIDEFAALLGAQGNGTLAKQIKASIERLVNEGRAPGFVVIGALQSPRKEIISMRDEFPDRVAMRMLSKDYSDMVLAPGAAKAGHRCDLIPRSQAGAGYAWLEDLGSIVKVRAAYVSDEEIRAMAIAYQPGGPPDEPEPDAHIDEALEAVEQSWPDAS